MRPHSADKVKLTSIEELLGVPDEQVSIEIEVSQISGFKNHPFKVQDDDKMADLVESVRIHGILTPVLVRNVREDSYEMISGHRRLHAAKLAGLETIPAIIKDLTDDEATIVMVDSNIQREELLPSEKAFAYKMKLSAMKRQGLRSDLTSCQIGTKYRSDVIMAQQVGESARSIQRYIRLTELIPELLEMVDQKRLPFTTGVDISYIDPEVQKWLSEYIHENGAIKAEQVVALRKTLDRTSVDQHEMIQILNDALPVRYPSMKVTISEQKLYEYFPSSYSSQEMQDVIYTLLAQWKNEQGR